MPTARASWLRATVPPALVAFYRDGDGGWHHWDQSPPLPPTSEWTEVTWTTPTPPGAVGLGVGMLLDRPGSFTVDDLSVTRAAA